MTNPITQLGQINTTAQIVPGLYVQIAQPANVLINGVPTNVLGIVGTASDGPVNSPVIIGDMRTQINVFGAPVNRKYDLGTVAAVASLQGANNLRCVRVTDGTDTAATGVITATGTALTLTAAYTGSNGNKITAQIATGSAPSSFALLISKPGVPTERFDNLTGSGNAFWVNAAAAINNGQNGVRGKSGIVIATAGTGTGTPTLGTPPYQAVRMAQARLPHRFSSARTAQPARACTPCAARAARWLFSLTRTTRRSGRIRRSSACPKAFT